MIFLSKWQKSLFFSSLFKISQSKKIHVCVGTYSENDWLLQLCNMPLNMMPLSYIYMLCPIFTLHRILLWGQLLQFTSLPRCLHLPSVTTDQDESAKRAAVTGCRNGGLPVPWAAKRENTGEWLINCGGGWNIHRHC